MKSFDGYHCPKCGSNDIVVGSDSDDSLIQWSCNSCLYEWRERENNLKPERYDKVC